MCARFGTFALLVCLGTPAAAQQAKICTIVDTSGTPTNIRLSAGGEVRGTVANGTKVQIVMEEEAGGRPWALLTQEGARVVLGWVARSLVKC